MAERKLGRSVREEILLPYCGQHIWEWYLQLQSSGETLSYQEIESWSRLTKTIIYPEEIEILQDLFLTRRDWWNKRKKAKHD